MRNPVTVTLTEPIEAHGDKNVTSLTLRAPNGRDMRLAGYPFQVTRNGQENDLEMDAAAGALMISQLAGIPPTSVDEMNAFDFTACMGAIMGFFAPASPNSPSSDTSSSRDGGATSPASST